MPQSSSAANINVDINQIATDLNLKADTDLINATPSSETVKSLLNNAGVKYVVETFHNGTSWYRVYSDGWCEQGGYFTSGDNQTTTITFMKAFNNTDYQVLLTQKWSSVNYNANTNVQSTSTDSMVVTGQSSGVYWQASGYIS